MIDPSGTFERLAARGRIGKRLFARRPATSEHHLVVVQEAELDALYAVVADHGVDVMVPPAKTPKTVPRHLATARQRDSDSLIFGLRHGGVNRVDQVVSIR